MKKMCTEKRAEKLKYIFNSNKDIYKPGYCIGGSVCAPGLDGSTREHCCNR